MKRSIIIFTILLVPAWFIGYTFVSKNEPAFDPTLEKALENELGTSSFSKKILQTVDSLDLSNYHLTSLDGLEAFEHLEELNVRNNMLEDVSIIGHLEQLKTLDLRGNLIQSLESFRDLNKLEYLNLRDNRIDDISPLQANIQLEYLNLRENSVEHLDELAHLTHLDELNIRDNKIKSIAPLVNLPLKKRLNVSGNDIKDLGLLAETMDNIKDVDFELTIDKPKLSVEGGFYDDSFTLEMETDEDYEIYYTLDGSTPNTQSEKYTEPITMSKELIDKTPIIANERTSAHQADGFSFTADDVQSAVTLKAVAAYKENESFPRTYSHVTSATYIFDDALESNDLPILSLSVDPDDLFNDKYGIYTPGIWYEEDTAWSGNYAQRGRDHEKLASLDMFNSDKELTVHQDVGVRIHGRGSRVFPQKSLRIYARNDYGQKHIHAPIFEDINYNRFRHLILRNSGQDVNSTLMRDGLMHELVKHLDVDVQAYEPAIVLINGEYWGIHNIRERLNKHFIKTKYNINKDELALLKVFRDGTDEDPFNIDFEVKEGSNKDKQEFLDLIDYVEANDMSNRAHLTYIEDRIDLDNFLHYVAYLVYYANTDSFSNNLNVWRKTVDEQPSEEVSKGHDGKWRWMLFDLDAAMGGSIHNPAYEHDGDIVEYNMMTHVLADQRRMSLFKHLMENEEVERQFVTIMIDLLDHEFAPERVIEKIDERSDHIRHEIPRSIGRWHNIESTEAWENNVQELRDFAERRPALVKEHLKETLDLTDEDLY